MKKIKLTYLEIIAISNHLNNFKTKPTSLGWAASRTSYYLGKVLPDYFEQLKELIKVYSKKDEKGNPILKEGTQGNNITDYDFENEQDFVKNLTDLQKTEVEVDIYEASKEKAQEYINSNPAPAEYEIFLGNILNPEYIG